MKRQILSALGALVLTVSMSSGIAMAQSTDVSVDIICSELGLVDISSSSDFDQIDLALNETTSSTAPGAIEVTVDVGCYFQAWHVDATVSPFWDGGLLFFPGTWMTLDFVSDSGPLVQGQDGNFDPVPGFPPGDGESDDEIFGTAVIISGFGFDLDTPAPGPSSATYTGNLTLQGPVFPATYTSTITVSLTKEPLIHPS